MSQPTGPRFFRFLIPAIALGGAVLIASIFLGRHEKSSPATAQAEATDKVSFIDHVQPLLSEYCFHCHGPDAGSRKGDLRLDREEYAFLPREKGPATIVRGDPDRSLLIQRIESTKADEVMPPPEGHKTLSPAQIAVLRRWVEQGAEYREHWAYITPTRPDAPEVKDKGWVRNGIDGFVLASLEKAGFSGAEEADKHSLLRRVTFDLTGLPPTPAEIGDFVSDTSPNAYEGVVDRLLASPRFGEHRARYWLDYVRYGDTNGEHADNARNAWPYRDYIINAFNRNLSFDQFITEQLAGDLLPPSNVEQLVASQFNRLNITTNEGGNIVERVHLIKVKDRTETVGAVFLGMTMGCAACHDHKFDPITQKDYYALSAFFNNMPDGAFDGNLGEAYPDMLIPPAEKREEAEQLLRARAAVHRKLLDREGRAKELLQAWIDAGGPASLQAVSTEALQARFRLDEADGNVVRNSAPNAQLAEVTLEGRDHFWGGSARPVKHWTGLRFGVQTRLKAASIGDFEKDQPFSVGGWFLPRERSGTSAGAFVSRMSIKEGGRGWDLYWKNAAGARRPAPKKPADAKAAAALAADVEAEENRPEPEGQLIVNLFHKGPDDAISVRSKGKVSRKEWAHLAFTYDGSGKASGLKLYLNGELQQVDILKDGLTGTIRTDAPLQLARRTDGDASPETGFQDVQVFGRQLSDAEVRSMSHEDLAREILARPMKAWTADDHKLVGDFYFRQVDPAAIALRTEMSRLTAEFKRASAGGLRTMVAMERDSRPIAFVQGRGDWDAVEERVDANVPHVLPPLPPALTYNRLDFARWLVAPENPLTSRVAVNRMWQELFGRGIVDTPQNFGTMGSPPSHPQLLDWLAVDFRESGWDVKRFYRQAVLSATYRQAAKISPELLARDPDNKLFGRGPRFRLDGEMIRDQALAASGLLVDKLGGPGTRPYQVAGIWEEGSLPNQGDTREYVQDQGEGLYRRSVYTFWKRTAINPIFGTFDAPRRDVCVVQRQRSNSALQALVTENATDYLETARHIAARALHAPDSGESQKLQTMSLLLLNRPLSAEQQDILQRSLEKFRRHFANEEDARAFLAIGDSPVDETLPATEHAAWMLAASQLINTDQALNK